MVKLVDVIVQVASLELGKKVIETMKKVCETMYHISSFHNVYFCGLVNEPEVAHGETLSDFNDLVLSDGTDNARSGRENASSH